MLHGKVIFFNKKNRFGFIKCTEDGQNYYVHEKDLAEPIEKDDEVAFDLRDATRGQKAVGVKKLRSGRTNG